MEQIKVGEALLLKDKLPEHLIPSPAEFRAIWGLHPSEFNKIKMYDNKVALPRWQQAYGKDYYFSGQVSEADPVPADFTEFLYWAKELNEAYNGLLVNWYDSDLKHYIGRHTDSIEGLVPNSPIITISLGASRVFRLRKKGKYGYRDLIVNNGDVVAIPWETNLKFTHEVPYLGSFPGKRISVTIRAFK